MLLSYEMNRFFNFKRRTKPEYALPTVGHFGPHSDETISPFLLQTSKEELEKINRERHEELDGIAEKERIAKDTFFTEIESLEKKREVTLLEAHLTVILEENRIALKEKLTSWKALEKFIKKSKAHAENSADARKESVDNETTIGEERETPDEDPRSLLDKLFGDGKHKDNQLEKYEPDITEKIESAKSDRDLRKIKATIFAKQTSLLYALSKISTMQYYKEYPGKKNERNGDDGPKKRKVETTESKLPKPIPWDLIALPKEQTKDDIRRVILETDV